MPGMGYGALGSGPHSHFIMDDPKPLFGEGALTYGGVHFAWNDGTGPFQTIYNNNDGNVLVAAGGKDELNGNGDNGMGHDGNTWFVVDPTAKDVKIDTMNVAGMQEPFHGPDHLVLDNVVARDGTNLNSQDAFLHAISTGAVTVSGTTCTGQNDAWGNPINDTVVNIHGAHGADGSVFAGIPEHELTIDVHHTGSDIAWHWSTDPHAYT